MSALSRGDRVVDPDDATRTAVIVDGPQVLGGRRFYLVRNQVGEESYFDQADLARKEVAPDSPVSWLTEQALADPDHLARLVTQLKLTSNLTDIIYSLSSTRTLFRVHQFKPVLKLIESPAQRLLLADEVGLGKTIEAGLIWAEIDARTATKRVLVVCPSSLRAKWQTEMRRRFDRELEIVDRSRFLELLDLHHERGDSARFGAIASYAALRSDEVLEVLSNRPPTLDLVIMDEAHALRNSATRTNQLGELLAQNTAALLFLSATPVNLGSGDLYQLLHLLQPDQFSDPAVFERVLAPNEHVNAALRLLTSAPGPDGARVAEVLRRVEGTAEAARYLHNPLYRLVLRRLESGQPLGPGEVNACAQQVTSLNTLSGVYIRTRKRDLTDHTAIRRPHTIQVGLTDAERAVYDGAVALVARLRSLANGIGTGLATVMPARQAASCLPVMADYLAELLTEGRLRADFEEGEEDDEGTGEVQSVATTVEARSYAAQLIALSRELRNTDSKLARLVDYLYDLRKGGSRQVLLFSFFRRTLGYLKEQLSKAGFVCEVMHGGTPLRDRDVLLRNFRHGDIDLLLCSEIGSEGLDFEFSNVVINYDLPWNPMRLEQRIGRVDRFGQSSDVVHIVNFEVPGTIDTEIFLRLYRRIGVFERSIGELEPILGERLQELNRVLASSDLTVQEQTELANRIALAVERERGELENFEVQKDRLVGADAYVSESVGRAYQERRYMTPEELGRYVDGFLREEASPAKLSTDGSVVALMGSAALADHLREYGRAWNTPDFGDLVARLETGGPIAATFDADTAYEREAEFLHGRHPLVRTISEYYSAHPSLLPPGGYARVVSPSRQGSYIFFIYRVTAGGLKASRSLLCVAYDRGAGQVDFDAGRDLLAYLAGPGPVRMQQRNLPILDSAEISRGFSAVQDQMVAHRDKMQRELQERNDALIAVREQVFQTSLEVQRARLSELAERPGLDERIRRMRTAQISNLERKTQLEVSALGQYRRVAVGFKVVAGGLVDFVVE